MLETLKKMLAGEPIDQPTSGLSKREWTEFPSAPGRSSNMA